MLTPVEFLTRGQQVARPAYPGSPCSKVLNVVSSPDRVMVRYAMPPGHEGEETLAYLPHFMVEVP